MDINYVKGGKSCKRTVFQDKIVSLLNWRKACLKIYDGKVCRQFFLDENISKLRRYSCWKSAPQICAVEPTGLKSLLK